MKQFPSIPRIADAPDDLLREGHLWVLEKVDGANFRFQLQSSGLLRFGDRSQVYDDPDDVPGPYQHAVRHVQTTLDREALRSAVEDIESIIFFREAMHQHTIDYDWERTPSFLGFDVWDGEAERFLPPDRVEQVFDRLGLQMVPVVKREQPAKYFDPSFDEIPNSQFYDGPAEGIVITNKRGKRAKRLHPDFQEVDETVPVEADPQTLARKYATERRFEKLVGNLDDREQPVTFDRLYDLTLEDIVREEHKRLFHGRDPIDMSEFRSEVAGLTRAYLDA